jgi:hypothetical protein
LSASQVFPPIFAAAAFIAIGLFVTHFTDVWVGPWVMWLTAGRRRGAGLQHTKGPAPLGIVLAMS